MFGGYTYDGLRLKSPRLRLKSSRKRKTNTRRAGMSKKKNHPKNKTGGKTYKIRK